MRQQGGASIAGLYADAPSVSSDFQTFVRPSMHACMHTGRTRWVQVDVLRRLVDRPGMVIRGWSDGDDETETN